ncbi:MAG: 30S ribosomal protein S1 [Candidatus Margulisiibacteriota bacterium]
MAEEELKGTNIEKGKGEEEFFEVEDLIKETLEESKLLEEKEAPPPPAKGPAEGGKKEEFKATKIALPSKEKEAAPPSAGAPAPKPSVKAPGYEATFKEYKVGDIVKGTVLKIDPSGILVDIKYKADGLILTEELSDKSFGSPEEIVKVGEVIDVYIENLENKEGYAVLSKKRADYEKRWRTAYDAYKNKKILEGKVIQILQGGLVLDCEGIRGFIPASQVLKRAKESLDSFKDKMLPVKVIEINRRQGKIVLSHKLATGEKEKYKAEKVLEDVEVGQVRHGIVSSIKSFGAFVDIGGIEGLIHLSELSWKRVKHPSDVLKLGQELDVFVLGVDKINKKVALGLKELQPDPWVNAADYFKPGQIVKVKIMRFAKFGAFAELEHDLEGLIHISEMSKEPVQKPEDAAKIGDVIDVKILRVLPEEQKIGLSIKEALLQKERAEIKKTAPPEESTKVTIGDMIAQKEKEKTEREAEEEEQEEVT